MARSRKKTLPQKVVNVSTTGMPSPVRKFFGSRIIALLIVLSIPVLLATGLVSVKWENGRPKLSINRQKAAEVKREAAETIQEFQDERSGNRLDLPNVIPSIGGQENSRSGVASDWGRDDQFGDNLAEGVERLKDRFGEQQNRAWDLVPVTGEQTGATRQANGPLSKLRQQFENRR